MNGFLKWFFAFISEMLKGWGMIFSGIGNGIIKIFSIKNYINIFKQYSRSFDAVGWILSILAIIIVIAIYVLLFLLIVMAIRKYIRFRHSIVSNEDLLEEISVLQRRVIKMTKEKDEIMAMKVAQIGVPAGTAMPFGTSTADLEGESPEAIQQAAGEEGIIITQDRRFNKLFEVDMFYKNYTPPEYDNEIELPGICERFRGFACSRMHLYYDIKTVRLFLAGMASTKLIILQGISGTGKTLKDDKLC